MRQDLARHRRVTRDRPAVSRPSTSHECIAATICQRAASLVKLPECVVLVRCNRKNSYEQFRIDFDEHNDKLIKNLKDQCELLLLNNR